MNCKLFVILILLGFCQGIYVQTQANNNTIARQATIQPIEQDPGLLAVQQFYRKYITELLQDRSIEQEQARETILKQYLTPQFFDKLRWLFQEMELDYDPFLEAQDCDPSVLEKLQIEKDTTQADVYRIYLWDNYHQKYKEVKLHLKQEGNKYKIDNILGLNP